MSIFVPLIIYYLWEYDFLEFETEAINAFIVNFSYYNVNYFKSF